MQRLSVLFLGLLLAFGVLLQTASAQQLTASIKGTVTDATGAAIPDAQVTATNTQTGVTTTVTSQSDGVFQFLQLPVGVYNVSVTKTGFTTSTTNRIQLVLNQTYNLPVTLQVGGVTQAIEVQANAAQVETNNTQLSTVVESQKIVDLPLNGRNWVQLQQLAPGVVSTSDRFGSNYATNGSQSQQNSFLINGADAIDLPINVPEIIPSPDAIGEFDLIDSSANPEYSRNSGGILNAIIKSGTNSFHGDVFEFYRDTFLNGRNIYQLTKPIFHQNQFGGTLGGPIWKDHTFFFISYQGTRNRSPQTGEPNSTPVFTAAQRGGVWPGLATSKGTSPFPLVGDDGVTYPAGTPYSTIFSGGFIPAADFNPIASKLMSTYVPLPNAPGGVFNFNPISTVTDDQGIARIDHTFGAHDSIWASLLFDDNFTPSTLPFLGATLPGFAEESTTASKVDTFDWTHTFGGTTVNELRLSYYRFNFVAVEPVTPTLPSSVGFAINPQNTAGAGLPFMTVTGFFNLGFSPDGPQPRIDQTYELADNFSKIIGGHTLKFGFDGKRYDVDNPFFGTNNGSFTFGGAGTYTTGLPGADFELGIPDSYTQGSGGWISARTYEYYGYFQDSWKKSQNLTLNYGLAYQVDTPTVNRQFYGEDVNCFIPGEQSHVFPTAPNGMLWPGDPGCTKSGYNTYYGNIGPRVGFAYSPGGGSNKTFVIRGGWGMYYNRYEEELTLQNLTTPPFSITSAGVGSIAGSPSFANPFVDIKTGASVPNPFPFTGATPGSSVNFAPFEPMGLNTISPDFRDPYAMNYNLNIQKQLGGSMVLQVGYVGAQGRHLEMAYEGDPISLSFPATCLGIGAACTGNAATLQAHYPGSTIYSPFVPANVISSVGIQNSVGNSDYNSLQVSLTKRLSHGLSFLAAYTYGHSIDDASGFENSGFQQRGTDPWNFRLDRGDSAFDARHRLVVSYDYELPHLSRFWNNGFTRSLLDGWHFAGITTFQTGFPVLIAETDFKSLQCSSLQFYGCWDTANVVAPVQVANPRNSVFQNNTGYVSPPTLQNYYYFNPNDFSPEVLGVLGNAGRNNFHGPGIANTDLNLAKRVYFTHNESRFIELRLEGYNVFNHTQFVTVPTTNGGNGVDGNIVDSNFGRVLNANIGRTIQLGAKIYF